MKNLGLMSVVFSSLFLAVFLAASVHRVDIVPWSTSPISIPGLPIGSGKFGLSSFELCSRSEGLCVMQNYENYRKYFENADQCEAAGEVVMGTLVISSGCNFLCLLLLLAQVSRWSHSSRFSSLSWVRTSIILTLLGALSLVVGAIVWSSKCVDKLRTDIPVDLSLGFGLCLTAGLLPLLGLLLLQFPISTTFEPAAEDSYRNIRKTEDVFSNE